MGCRLFGVKQLPETTLTHSGLEHWEQTSHKNTRIFSLNYLWTCRLQSLDHFQYQKFCLCVNNKTKVITKWENVSKFISNLANYMQSY